MLAPELVHSAEEFIFDSVKLRELLTDRLSRIDLSELGALVLGCTHFIYFKPLLFDILPKHIKLVDGNEGTINRLSSLIKPIQESHMEPIACSLSGHVVNSEFIIPYLNFCVRHNLNQKSNERTSL